MIEKFPGSSLRMTLAEHRCWQRLGVPMPEAWAWVAAGLDHTWHASGYGLDEAQTMTAQGTAPDAFTRAVLTALRNPHSCTD